MSIHNTKKNENGQSTKGLLGNVVLFWKTPGETLAVMLRRFREEQHLSPDEKLTYAGRLDPMAEGIVPILVGEARFQKEQMMAASKTYEVDIVLGIGTDTGDMLGLASPAVAMSEGGNEVKGRPEIEKALATLSQTVSLPYPNYSSIPVEGKPLFMHARANNKVVLPIKKVTIYNLELVSIKIISLKELLNNAIEIIEKVQGDFRQEEIVKQWKQLMEGDSDSAEATTGKGDKIQVVTIRTTVSSGTYMRSLAEKLGKLLKIPALAGRIVRTSVEHK